MKFNVCERTFHEHGNTVPIFDLSLYKASDRVQKHILVIVSLRVCFVFT